MLNAILLGIPLTVLTVATHAVGTMWWLSRLQRNGGIRGAMARPVRGLKILCLTATVLLVLHIVEVMAWAVTYRLVPDITEMKTVEEAAYFSIVTFTTVGYGDIVIHSPWRILSGIESMAGLLVFGWSAALFFAVFEQLIDRR